jgi:seryl-tRNA synthetase
MSDSILASRTFRAAGSALTGELADVAAKLVYFVSPDITQVRRAKPGLLEIELDARTDESAAAKIELDVAALLARLGAGHRPLPPRRLFERSATSSSFVDGRIQGGEALTAHLVEAGWARCQSSGAYAFGPRFVALIEAIDARLRRLATGPLGAQERSFPPLISADALHRAGYLASFPQSVSFVSHLPQRLDVIERFRAENARAPRFVLPAECMPGAPAECLPPAVCYHRFAELEGASVARGSIITARGACFRYEARHNMRDLSRLWCFQMREIVYAGAEPFVRDAAARSARVLEELTDDLDLAGVCETASDPFFADVLIEKRYAQLAHDRKLELRVPLGGGETLAVASINTHEDFFARAFSIEASPGSPTISGCMAFGLERLALGFLARHGLDEGAWPAVITTTIRERAHELR